MLHFGKTLAQFDQFLLGAGVTLFVSLLGAIFGLAVGLLLFFMREAKWKPVRFFARLYISFVRGTPLLVQIFLVYYALPGLTGIDLRPFTAGVLALSLNSGAFAAEIIRGGLTRVSHGQYEAADALGLPRFVTWFKVILPQVIRFILPPLVNEFTLLVKASTLLSVITVVDLTRTAQNIMNTTYRPVEAFIIAAALYFVMLFVLSTLARQLEKRNRVQRS
ncbi:amino acid ABC transporter permease [Taklimakanibacter deserti]|uniref:amino acid ABC transporter permease n=1 Tax=Taklimakanibacter deserti TaxID=2267839 RepID=UPI000E64E3A2